MPTFKIGNIWSVHNKEWICITTNSYIKKDGTLAMGRGVAKDALEMYPDLDKILGGFVNKVCGNLGFYGVGVVSRYNLIALQTKYHHANKSSIELISKSINKLGQVFHPDELNTNINIPFPGIGYGQLTPSKVYKSCLKDLPANYIIWSTEPIIL